MINNMIKMIKKFLITFFLVLVLFVNEVNAYYSYENRFTIFKFNRNNIPANGVISYDKTTITNQDVEVKMNFDKVISIIGDNKGLEISEDGKSLTKILDANETNKLLIRDEDFNYQEVEYKVNWIDKEPPVISGAEDRKIYNNNVHLEFTDNFSVKEIYADYYSDSFSIYTDTQDFYETDNMRIVPANRNVIIAYVLSNTKQIEKYNYYIDGMLCATTHDKKYIFTGLELSDEEHHIVVEGLDRYGKVVETRETYRKTIPIDGISIGNNQGVEYVSIRGVPENLTKITAYIWVWGRADSILKLTPTSNSSGSYLVSIFMANHKNYSGRYMVKFEMEYVEDGVTKTANIIGSVDMPNKYKELNYSGIPNDFVENGNYYVRCTDEAGNENEIDFTLKK